MKMSEGRGTYRLDDVVDQFLGFVDFLLRVGHDQTMEILFLVTRVGSIRPAFAFFDGTFATNGNLSAGVCLHLLQCVTTGSDK